MKRPTPSPTPAGATLRDLQPFTRFVMREGRFFAKVFQFSDARITPGFTAGMEPENTPEEAEAAAALFAAAAHVANCHGELVAAALAIANDPRFCRLHTKHQAQLLEAISKSLAKYP